MKRWSIGVVLLLAGVSAPPVQACRPVYHENPVRDFIRESRLDQSSRHVIFTGEVLSVRDYRNGKGDMVRDTTIRPSKWWLGSLSGSSVLVRSITPAMPPPCGPPPALEVKVGEQWLVFGWVRDDWVEPYTDPRVTVSLTNGRIARGMSKELRRIERIAAFH